MFWREVILLVYFETQLLQNENIVFRSCSIRNTFLDSSAVFILRTNKNVAVQFISMTDGFKVL